MQYLLGKVGPLQVGRGGAAAAAHAPRDDRAPLRRQPGDGRELPRLEPLEVFINQAGIALENAFLQRKVQALQGQQLG